jgi:hypothetical protein
VEKDYLKIIATLEKQAKEESRKKWVRLTL